MLIFRKIALLCCLLMLVVLTGCKSKSSNETALVGKWRFRESSAKNNDPIKVRMLRIMELEFRSDKTYSLRMGFLMQGAWTIDDAGIVMMKPTKIGGKDISKLRTNKDYSRSFQLNTKNSTLIYQPPVVDTPAAKNPLLFEKAQIE